MRGGDVHQGGRHDDLLQGKAKRGLGECSTTHVKDNSRTPNWRGATCTKEDDTTTCCKEKAKCASSTVLHDARER